MISLEGKVALVTGASRGIGAAVARSLASHGAHLGLASRSGDDLGIEGAVAAPCDVRRPDDLESLAAATAERFGGVDILVANAGVGAYGPFLDLPPDQLEEMIDVNVKGTLYAVRATLPYLLKSDAADIVTLASEAGRRGLPYEAVYCASKFAQVGFTRAMDHELRETGRALHERLPRRSRHGFRDGPRAHTGDAGARRDDDLGGRCRSRPLRAHAPTEPPHSRDGLQARDGAVMGVDGAVRWGFLSTANINDKLLPGAEASPDVDVVAVASRDAGRAEAYARERGIERAYGSYDELLADPEVEAVYISLPNSMHVEWSIRALEAGKHVLCEKPLSRHPEDVERAFDAAEKAGRILMEAFMYRHNPQTKRLVELVESGAIGRLRLVRAAFSFPLDDASNVRLNAELEGGGAHGRRLLLRLGLQAPRWRA